MEISTKKRKRSWDSVVLIDPTRDVPFKKLCENRKILISLLNTFLQLPSEKKIVNIEPVKQESYPEIFGFKSLRFDVICKDIKGSTFIVEMQKHFEPSFGKRSLYYWSKVYSSQLEEGEKYSVLHPVILLVFLNFELFENKENYIHHFRWKNDRNELLSEEDRISFVEISKFEKTTLTCIEDEWMNLFKNYGTSGIFHCEHEEIKTAFGILKSMTQSVKEMEKYEEEISNSKHEEMIEQEAIEKGIQQGREEGRKEGIEQGIKQGREEGKEEGREEGIEEGKEKIAIEMIKEDEKLENILKFCKLSKEKVKGLFIKYSQYSSDYINDIFQ
jgi:predicted transposase/invertase (TIGR01784 family)